MSSRIVTNTDANTVYLNYSKNQMALSSSIEKLSTGLAINRASDDPAGLAISETLRAQTKATDSAVGVIANVSNFINTADSFLQNVNDILGRMSELAVKYNDPTLSTSDQANITTEFNALTSEISNTFSQAKFNGQKIFNGQTATLMVDANGTQYQLAATDLATLSATITSLSGTTDTQSLADVQKAISTISAQRANLGADQSRLNYESSAQQNYSNNIAAAESRIRNVDMAKESANFARDQVLVQASTSMLSQANQSGQSVLKLLQ